MALPTTLAVAAAVATLAGPQPAVQQQTPEQKRLVAHWAPLARKASAAAADSTAALFAHNATRRFLHLLDDGSGLWNLPARELEERFWGEIEAAELVHNFGYGKYPGANCGFDLTVALGRASNVFLNQWQLQVDGAMPVDVLNNQFTEWSETTIFGFEPFRSTAHPDAATAASRPVYGALNMYRSSGGNPQCGPVAAIFKRSFIAPDALMTPLDTGLFSACKNGETAFGAANQTIYLCTAWPQPWTLGLMSGRESMKHLLSPFLHFYNGTQANVGAADYPYLNLARLTMRLLSRRTYGAGDGHANDDADGRSHDRDRAAASSAVPAVPAAPVSLNFVENTLGYFETNPVVNLTMDGGVKMMVGMFEWLWGTAEGAQLQQWCRERGWPLAWAYNPAMTFFQCGPDGKFPGCSEPSNFSEGIDTANARLLDLAVLPHVPAGGNVSIATADSDYFAAQWTAVNVTGATGAELDAAWAQTFARLAAAAAVEPLYAGACADPDCVGVAVHSRDCVC